MANVTIRMDEGLKKRSGALFEENRRGGDLAGWWSRRIDSANRIVCRVSRNELELLQCGGHYRN
jgi:Txe/YoeB family toxin of Txe-Axe toxin-antitoxin module